MQKIGLISVHNPNYGSMLQTYALHTFLKTNGFDNEIILYTKKKDWKQFLRIFNISLLRMKGRVVYRDLYCKIFHKKLFISLNERTKKFDEFKTNYFTFSRNHIGWNDLLTTKEDYDTFVLGSDQVWNPINIGTDFFNLLFVPEEKYKVTYAPSFGVSSIPASQIKKTHHYLNRIQSISVREIAGQKIIKTLTGRNVPVVCDPTILIDKKYWDELQGEKRVVEEKYIFCYFLGNNSPHRDFANKFKEKTGHKLVALTHLDELILSDVNFADIQPFNIGPAEFINLISNAEFVLTDSFHGTIFSLLYEKQFYTFSRFESKTSASTNSRIESLLHSVGINNRHLQASNNIDDCLQLAIDYNTVQHCLDNIRTESRNYLFNALKDCK